MVKFSKKNHRSGFTRTGGNRFRPPSVFSSLARQPEGYVLPAWSYKLLVYFIILISLAYVVFYSSFFEVNDVMVEGNHFVTSDKIKSFIPEGSNIFRLDINKVKGKILHDVPEIKNLSIYRGIPNAVKIIVVERDAKLVWQSGDNTYLISSQGEVAKQLNPDEIFDAPRVVDLKNIPVQVGTKIVSANFVNFISSIYNQFNNEINIKPLNFDVIETTFDVNLHTEAGFYVKLDTLRSSKSQLDNLKRVLTEKRNDIHEYVDLRIAGWAYYK